MKEKITLAFHCHEQWDRMEAHDSGRHCGVCDKEVIDFTRFSDEELKTFFASNSGNFCGRYTSEQARVRKGKALEWLRGIRLNTIATMAFLAAKLIPSDAGAQDSSRVNVPEPDNEKLKNQKKLYGDSTIFFVEGKVKKALSKEGIGFVSIEIKVNDITVGYERANSDGSFSLNIPAAHGGEKITLIFSRRRYRDAVIDNFVADGQPLVVRMKKSLRLRFRRYRHVMGVRFVRHGIAPRVSGS